jgi:hypothetical protein
MTDKRFNIIFRGEIAPGNDVDSVKNNLQKLTGFDDDRIKSIFTSPETVIKSNIDKATAERYLAALTRTGVVCRLIPLDKPDRDGAEEPVTVVREVRQITCPKCGTRQPAGTCCASCGIVYEKIKTGRKRRPGTGKTWHRSTRLPLFIVLLLLIGGGGAAWWYCLHEGGVSPNNMRNRPMIKPVGSLMGGSVQGVTLNLSGLVRIFVGSPEAFGSTDGIGTAARLSVDLFDITTDGSNLYLADFVNSTIRKVDIATGAVTTLAGTAGSEGLTDGVGAAARFARPEFITTDGSNLYVPQGSNIRVVNISTAEVTTLQVTATETGITDTRDVYPDRITTDGRYLYVTGNKTIGRIEISTGVYTTIAGDYGRERTKDGVGSDALFERVWGITTDGTNLYVTDKRTIRKIVLATGEVTTLAGVQYGPDAKSGYEFGHGITTDGKNLYVSARKESDINDTILQIDTATGDINPYGIGTLERFELPHGITTDGKNLYVVECLKGTIKKVTASAVTVKQ